MKIEIIRLGSVIANGVGGPGAAAIGLIYSMLLQHYNQDVYKAIIINQIDENLEEIVMKHGGQVNVNIRYPARQDFDELTELEQNKIRIEVLHEGLIRIAARFGIMDVSILNQIKEEVIQKGFIYSFKFKPTVNKKDEQLAAYIVVEPSVHEFKVLALVEKAGEELCKVEIYRGAPHYLHLAEFFSIIKWKGINELLITGKAEEVETHLNVSECKVKMVNLTPYARPPKYEMFKAEISNEEKNDAYKDWIHSLPPGAAGIIESGLN